MYQLFWESPGYQGIVIALQKKSEIYHHNFNRFRVKYETFPKLDVLLSIKTGVQVSQIGDLNGFNKSKIGRVSTNNGGTQKSFAFRMI
jgi:hypothetical protein